MIDIRILPLNRFDISNENYIYFIDCLLGSFELLCVDDLISGNKLETAAADVEIKSEHDGSQM
jgi:hypothetical protein